MLCPYIQYSRSISYYQVTGRRHAHLAVDFKGACLGRREIHPGCPVLYRHAVRVQAKYSYEACTAWVRPLQADIEVYRHIFLDLDCLRLIRAGIAVDHEIEGLLAVRPDWHCHCLRDLLLF